MLPIKIKQHTTDVIQHLYQNQCTFTTSFMIDYSQIQQSFYCVADRTAVSCQEYKIRNWYALSLSQKHGGQPMPQRKSVMRHTNNMNRKYFCIGGFLFAEVILVVLHLCVRFTLTTA